MALLNIGTGISDFREIITDNRYYIDKTGFIEDFFSVPVAKTTLITRPRRFGKTLTMSMLKEFFDLKSKDKENIFDGLAISRNKELCEKWQNQYPVVFITLKDCDGTAFKKVLGQFAWTLRIQFQEVKYLLQGEILSKEDKEAFQKIIASKADQTLLERSLTLLCKALYAYHGKKVILLIDEYDVPVNQAYHTDYYQDVIKFIRVLLGSVLKDAQYVQFAVLTGCLRISKESIFTGLNNFKCYGIMDDKFSNAIGFTSEEVDRILCDAELTYKKPEIKEWYDGYTFGKNKEMFCPWDVIQYVEDVQYDNTMKPKMYWENSSGNSIIKDFLKSSSTAIQKDFDILLQGGCVEIPLSDHQTYDLVHSSVNNFWNILYLTGYLTKASEKQIQEYGKEPEEGNALLVIPNKEVLGIYNTSIKEWFREYVIETHKAELMDAFWKGDEERVSELLCDILMNGISCRDYYETFYHGVLFGLFASAGCSELSNRESGLGYYDLFLMYNSSLCAVIEVKRADSITALEKEAEEALIQIEKKQYTDSVLGFKKILYWGMAFYQKRCCAMVRSITKAKRYE